MAFDKRRFLQRQELPDGSWLVQRIGLTRARLAAPTLPRESVPMLKRTSIINRSGGTAPVLLAGLLSLATLSGCGLARGSHWFRHKASVAPPSEPQGSYVPPHGEYSPDPVFETTPAPTPAERPMPIFPNDPPPPSTSEYLAPPEGRPETVPSQPVYGERPGLISPRNARRLPQGSERPAAAEMRPDSGPSFDNGPVASRQEFRPLFARFQQTSASR